MDDISGNIDQRLLEAYLATTYEVKHLGLQIKIGEKNGHLEEFLVDNNMFSWAFISAWNPFSKKFSEEDNEIRHKKLVKEVETRKFPFSVGFGIPANEEWDAEKSLLILGISRREAIFFGKRMEQNAVVWGRLGGVAELVVTK